MLLTHLWISLFLTLAAGHAEEEGKNSNYCFSGALSAEEEVFLSGASFQSGLCGASLSNVYLVPPADFSPQIEVSGCYCEHDGKVLFLLRSPEKPQGNTWCVPGGKLEKGETPTMAIVREVKEETGIDIYNQSLVYCREVYVRFPGRDLTLHIFRCHLNEMPEYLDIAPDEHSTYRWVTIDQALLMPLIPGGSECLRLAFSRY
ncbi:MAG: NUDIX hydrolase [Verrucomicrobia bacterium]|nr:NUDIX hydrolase [Verrucomicrobiota bacterium]